MATKINWQTDAPDQRFTIGTMLADMRVDGGNAMIYGTEAGDYILVLSPDGPANLPFLFGGKFLHYSDAIEAVMVDARQSEVDAL